MATADDHFSRVFQTGFGWRGSPVNPRGIHLGWRGGMVVLLILSGAWILQVLGADGLKSSTTGATPISPSAAQTSLLPLNDLPPNGHPSIRTYTDKDGLPQNAIMGLVIDSKGYLWAGSQDGAAYYNGIAWKVVNMPNRTASNYVRAMEVAPDESIWFGTLGGGVSQLKNGLWTTYTVETGSLSSNRIRSLAIEAKPDSRYAVWVGTYDKGIMRFDQGKWTQFTVKNCPALKQVIGSLVVSQDPQGQQVVWAGTYGSGLVRFDGQSWQVFDSKNSGLSNDKIHSLLETRSPTGNRILWIGTLGGGLVRWDGTTWTSYTPQNSQLKSDEITSIIEIQGQSGESILWVSSYGGGISRLENGSWTTFTTENSALPDNNVVCLQNTRLPRHSRMIWVGTNGSGIVRLDDSAWISYDSLNSGLRNKKISSLLETQGPDGQPVYWFGSDGGGVTRFANGQWESFDTSNSGLPNNVVYWLAESRLFKDRPTILAATYGGGLARFDGQHWTAITMANSGLPSNIVNHFIEVTGPDGEPELWVGTSAGLVHFAHEKWTLYNQENSGIPTNFVYCVRQTRTPDGTTTIWVGTSGAGLGAFSNGKWTRYTTANSQLPNNAVLSLAGMTEPDGRMFLWVGTQGGGAARIDLLNPTNEWLILSDSSETVRLPSNVIHKILQDQQHRIYLFTNKGIARLTWQAATAESLAEYSLYTYTTEDGIPASLSTAAMIDRRGRIWAGTSSGAAYLDLNRELQDRTPKPLTIERFSANGLDLPITGSELTLQHDQNNLAFEFALLCYVHEDDVRFRVQLEGYDATPTGWIHDRKAIYTNLGAGTYTFKVIGRDVFGNITAPTTLKIIIQPAPWLTWWAFLGYFFLIGGTGIGLYQWRVSILRKRQEERLRDLRQLLESTRVINSNLDLNTVLQSIAEEAARLVKGEPGGIGLVTGQEIEYRHVWNRRAWETTAITLKVDEDYSGFVARKAQPLIVNDMSQVPEAYRSKLYLEKFKIRGLLEVPIVSRLGKVVGILDIRRPAGRAPFTEADAQLITSLANQAAVAIENAELYGVLEEKNLFISESMKELEEHYRREQEVTRTLQQLNVMKNNFMNVTAHEMRTPITVLNGLIEALLDNLFGAMTPEQLKNLQTCHRMVERMSSTIEKVQAMLRITQGEVHPQPVRLNISNLLQSILTEVREAVKFRNLNFVLDCPTTLELEADPRMIRISLFNLIQNAIKFTHDGGEVAIKADIVNDQIQITIQDTGIGLDPEVLKSVFDWFYAGPDASNHRSGKFEFSARGLGLGLAIVKSYVEAHQGKVWAESAGMGQGSCFFLSFPLPLPTETRTGTFERVVNQSE
ncbi:MAG: GAF domain-containing protein [Acidobacteria bacterium]|nr:GAF domain-containing protein [Acidobacteriota bacterium]